MDQRRVERLSEQLRIMISDILEKDVSDPRLEMVNVNRIRLSRDGSFATVYYSRIGPGAQDEDCRAAMESASGFIRKTLASRLSLRTVPRLRFVYDMSLEEGEKVLGMLRESGEE